MRHLIFFPLFLFLGCANVTHKKISKINLIDEHTIEYIGKTSKTNAEQLEQLLTKQPHKIDTIVVTSTGGDVIGGMHIGRLVHQYNLKVIIKHMCGSSCANYIVTASHNVIVSEGAILGWHGGSTQPIYTSFKMNTSWLSKLQMFFNNVDENKEIASFIKRWQSEELQFFDMVGVNQAVTILGMMPGLKQQRDSSLFSYDKKTLHSLGLNIRFEDKEQVEHLSSGAKVVQIFNISSEELDAFLKLHNQKINENT